MPRRCAATVGADRMGDRGADSAVYFAFISRVAFGFAISLLFIALVVTVLSTFTARAYSQRSLLVSILAITRTCAAVAGVARCLWVLACTVFREPRKGTG